MIPFSERTKCYFFELITFIACFCVLFNCSAGVAGFISTYVGDLNSYRGIIKWAKKEFEIYTKVKAIYEHQPCEIGQDETLLTTVRAYLTDYKLSTLWNLSGMSSQASESGSLAMLTRAQPKFDEEAATAVASSFILVYRMTNRFNKFGQVLMDFLSSENNVCNYNQTIFETQWPSTSDHDDVVASFIKSCNQYDLWYPPDQFIDLLTSESKMPARLTADMAYEISKSSLDNREYVVAFEWIDYAINLVHEGDNTAELQLLHTTKSNIIDKHNEDFELSEPYDERYFHEKINPLSWIINATNDKDMQRRKDIQYYYFNGMQSSEYVIINSWGLCAGVNMQPEKVKAMLKCHLTTRIHPWFYINPLRVEVLSESPEIIQFHNILGDAYSDYLMSQIQQNPQGYSLVHQDEKSEQYTVDLSSRSSINTWLHDHEFSKLAKISNIVTGLEGFSSEPKTSEMFQGVEYVVGRYFKMHLDAVLPEDNDGNPDTEKASNERLATLLFYLNNVELEAGGATAFGIAGVSVQPIKGSAVFWTNMFQNGTVRTDGWHSSCALLHGNKFVINKWFRYYVQFLKAPCILDRYK